MLLAIPAPKLSPEIADIRRDITRGYVTEILESQDEILRNQGGYGAHALTIYEALKTDDQVQACMNQLIDGANKLEYELVVGTRKGRSPMRADIKAHEFCQEVVDNLDMKSIISEMFWTKFFGYGVAELLPVRDGENTILDFSKGGIRVRNRRRFRFDFDFNVRLLTLDNSYPGELMHPSRVWTARYGADNSDEPYGLGDASGCYWWVIFKKGGVRSWLRFLREFAYPTPVFRHPPNISEEGKTEIEKAAADIEAGRPTALSNNVELSFLEASRSGTSDYNPLVDVCNRSIARVLLGATETTESSQSSGYAQAKVHENVLDSTITSIDRIVFEPFTRQVIPRLVEWNWRGQGVMYPILRRKGAEEDINVRADRDAKLFDLGIRLDPKAITKIYGEDYLVVEGENTTVLLNGAQITSLNQLTKDAAAGAIPIESARQLMIAALSIPEAIADKIVQPLLDKEKEAKAAESAQAEEEANLLPGTGNNQTEQLTPPAETEPPAEFAEFYALDDAIEFAAKPASTPPLKKNCTRGVYCIGKTGKGSCVKAGSKCKSKAAEGSEDYAAVATSKAPKAATVPKAAKPKAGDAALQEILGEAIAASRATEIEYWGARIEVAKSIYDNDRITAYAEAQIEYAKTREYKKLEDLTVGEKAALKKVVLSSEDLKKRKELDDREATAKKKAEEIEKAFNENFSERERQILGLGTPEFLRAKTEVARLEAMLPLAFGEEEEKELKANLKGAKAEFNVLKKKEAAEFAKVQKAKGDLYRKHLTDKTDIVFELSEIGKSKAALLDERIAARKTLTSLITKNIDPSAADMPDLGGKEREAELRKEAVRIYGKETVAKAEANLKKAVAESDLMVRLEESSLGLVIDGGRFKTSTELGNKGVGYDRKRLEVEDRAFTGDKGYVPDATKTAVYGYLGNKNDPYGVTQDAPKAYGSMAVVLRKESVRDRTSMSTEDTFRGLGVSRLDDPSITSLMPLVEKGKKTGATGGTDPYKESAALMKGLADSDGTINDAVKKTRSPYFEYQVHGGVKASEIGEIHYYDGTKPARKVEKWAKDNGVTIVRHPKPTTPAKKKGLFGDIPDDLDLKF